MLHYRSGNTPVNYTDCLKFNMPHSRKNKNYISIARTNVLITREWFLFDNVKKYFLFLICKNILN